MTVAESEKNRSFAEKVIVKGAEYGGLVGGIIGLLNGNIGFAAIGLGIALVAAIIEKRK